MNLLAVTTQLDLPEAHLLQGLSDRGVKVTLLRRNGSPYCDVLKAEVDQRDFELRSRVDFGAAWRLRKMLHEKQFEMIHCFSARALSAAVLAGIGFRHGLVAYRGTSGNIHALDPSAWLTYLNPRLDGIICVSDAVRAYMLSCGISGEKAVRIYKGHHPDWYTAGRTRSEIRQALGIAEETFVVGCVANIREVKGVDLLIESLQSIPEQLDILVLLVGDVRDPKVAALQRDASLMRRVRFLGYQKNATELVRAFDVSCLTSRRREGFPKSILESMCQGVPALVSDVGGMPEIVEHGVSGIVVPGGDSQAIGRAIIQLSQDRTLLRSYGEAARKRIGSHFPISATIEQTGQLYRRILSNRH